MVEEAKREVERGRERIRSDGAPQIPSGESLSSDPSPIGHGSHVDHAGHLITPLCVFPPCRIRCNAVNPILTYSWWKTISRDDSADPLAPFHINVYRLSLDQVTGLKSLGRHPLIQSGM